MTARRIRSMDGEQPPAFVCREEWIAARGGVDEMRRAPSRSTGALG